MKIERRYKIIGIFSALAIVGLVLVWVHLRGLKGKAEENRMELPVESESRVTTDNGEAIVSLDPATLEISGIVLKPITGNEAPYDGVVWLEGRAWIYAESETGHFVRREVVPDTSSEYPRYFIKTPVRGLQVVVTGAQLLLSEEFRSQIQLDE